jgi:hypothetical protein
MIRVSTVMESRKIMELAPIFVFLHLQLCFRKKALLHATPQ